MGLFDFEVATCVECGCDDNCACDLGCYWLRVDRGARKGVCSSCPSSLKAWDNQKVSEAAPLAAASKLPASATRKKQPAMRATRPRR